ncbi:murein hydrolase activator EnvC [Glaesserella parasuis]|uniref:Murein hydrolase activator EnvC n=2 Tax=Glaesserella parasuis TaxID=738 RepID=A0AA42EC77_GLAPU|nr:murein hydrolase activator EnvC [Glaesserella parasuis]MDD2165290.1 murein hydrolase activator EnvC [Glaesserella parasuis]MDD2167124.1 murein hydrolase activator EnvC [Glaesserella parasuis]MDG6230658.1 murein hydrolase activator EnvC [Glaesserella parasuis]MDG6308659.1 murein hydrolase activator EnvC [Glaesserella parasuis]MDG6344854.1 murein hydrolase activator EnvC [Glaesserella parasuis]
MIVLVYAVPTLFTETMAGDLSKIQQKSQELKNKIDEQKKKRDSLQSTLKNQEIEMGKVLNSLKQTEMTLSETRASIKRTEQEIKRLEKQEAVQKEKLKEQLDSAYRSGIHPSVLERLLSEEAKNADRMGAYYEHINQVRIDAIYELRRTQADLKARRDELKEQQKGQQTQLNEQKKQEKDLQKVKNERESTLRSIDKSLAQDQGHLENLKANEEALRNQLVQASNESEQQEKQDIAKLEQKKNTEERRSATESEKQQVRAGNGLSGKYRMPVSGKIINRFGSTQMGEIKWNGVVIQASAGTPVRAIAGGRVILATWLQGYGEVVVIEHGKGDMSLYGYNQSVNVRKGERVQAGQVIASVGNSGGQSRSALYFEIRRKGVAVNPLKWVQ